MPYRAVVDAALPAGPVQARLGFGIHSIEDVLFHDQAGHVPSLIMPWSSLAPPLDGTSHALRACLSAAPWQTIAMILGPATRWVKHV